MKKWALRAKSCQVSPKSTDGKNRVQTLHAACVNERLNNTAFNREKSK